MDMFKDLGVLFDSKLSFSPYVNTWDFTSTAAIKISLHILCAE